MDYRETIRSANKTVESRGAGEPDVKDWREQTGKPRHAPDGKLPGGFKHKEDSEEFLRLTKEMKERREQTGSYREKIRSASKKGNQALSDEESKKAEAYEESTAKVEKKSAAEYRDFIKTKAIIRTKSE